MNYEELLKRARENLPQSKGESRFELPTANAVIVKRTTSVRNFSDIAKTLRRDVNHIAKFMFKELALPGSVENGVLVLQGKVAPSVVNQRLQEYIKEYVLCKECGKPDTQMTKDGEITTIKCEACGAKRNFKGIK